MARNYIIFTFVFLYCQILSAQEHAITVIASPSKDSVVLRWTPTSSTAWKLLNKYGYRIERYTIMRDEKILDPKPLLQIEPIPMKTQQQSEWMKFVDKDDFVAIAAQAIYGETFQIDMKTTDISQIVTKAKELESRFSFALFAADVSARAASLSGLRYVDKTIKSNERYLYRIFSMIPDDQLSVTMGFVYTSSSEIRKLPQIQEVVLTPGDRKVLLSWNVRDFLPVYTGYYIEKSEDGGTSYMQINKIPYVYVNDANNSKGTYGTFIDSLKNNNQPVSYRIVGVTPFAELGPASPSFTSHGVAKADVMIGKMNGKVSESGKVLLQWDFRQENEELIKGFEVERSPVSDKGFKVISKILLPRQRNYEDVSSSGTNYYRIALLSQGGERKVSFPILVQQEDSIPPAPPIHLKAIIDTFGIVHLNWDKNNEPDLLGYKVYYSYFKNSEFYQVTISPIGVATFTDTVNIKTLTKKCYYKVAAVDKRFNTSGFSAISELIIPDVVPPVTVPFTSVQATEKGIELRWSKCSSGDAKSYLLFRRSQYAGDDKLIKQLPVDSTHWVDVPSMEKKYEYWLQVVDSSGLKSISSRSVFMTPLVKSTPDVIKNLSGTADRVVKEIHLKWKITKAKQIIKIQVFRYKNDQQLLSLYKTLPVSSTDFIDQNVNANTLYGYRVKLIYKNGEESMFSDEVIINF